ncbi:Vacuolar Protein Sorting-Associated [Abortiporus biennis]
MYLLDLLLLSPLVLGSPTGSRRLEAARPIPSFVLEFAPLSHLWSQETWFPSDISSHLSHVVPQVNFTNLTGSVTFQSIGGLPSDVFLTSKDPVEDQPEWMLSTENIPDANGKSGAPATIVVVEKSGGILDAFYFYFYSFNEGNAIFNITPLTFEDHIGDWEHSMVRFVNNTPSVLYLSAHSGGSAFSYSVVQKLNNRAITFIAGGTHANYATPGSHLHGPLNALNDRTDQGPLWDVTLNFRAFWFDNTTQTFSIASGGRGVGGAEENRGEEGTGWLNFGGNWGDQQYPVPEHGQFCLNIIGECKYSDGPTGPIAKNLGRTAVCQDESNCTIQTSL